ncbi:MAG: hypothetical protein C0498_01350 [Anaerolinea sp.]|nr:hypothetical protein [Anaerolinea sp.]
MRGSASGSKTVIGPAIATVVGRRASIGTAAKLGLSRGVGVTWTSISRQAPAATGAAQAVTVAAARASGVRFTSGGARTSLAAAGATAGIREALLRPAIGWAATGLGRGRAVVEESAGVGSGDALAGSGGSLTPAGRAGNVGRPRVG